MIVCPDHALLTLRNQPVSGTRLSLTYSGTGKADDGKRKQPTQNTAAD